MSNVWDHIRTHGLQDPGDRRTIVADDKLRAVFGKDRATVFELQNLLSPHLTAKLARADRNPALVRSLHLLYVPLA